MSPETKKKLATAIAIAAFVDAFGALLALQALPHFHLLPKWWVALTLLSIAIRTGGGGTGAWLLLQGRRLGLVLVIGQFGFSVLFHFFHVARVLSMGFSGLSAGSGALIRSTVVSGAWGVAALAAMIVAIVLLNAWDADTSMAGPSTTSNA